MDRALYVAMTGALETERAQTVNNHNLANANTIGFRAELAATEAAVVQGPGFGSRVNARLKDLGWDATPGGLQQTGGTLDVALRGNGWLAVLDANGQEAYTRGGALKLTPQGQLVTASGLQVLGTGGAISVPPSESLTIAEDGTVSVVPQGQGPETLAQVGRLKVIAPAATDLARGPDGLFRLRAGAEANPVAGPALVSGALESSNVNLPETLVRMIELSRQFEMQVKAIKAADDNERSAASLARL